MITVSEIFGPTIQGEGALIGRPTLFVRTAGCDYRCSWCDSLHAVDPVYKKTWESLSAAEIMAQLDILSDGQPLLVTLSGGNPALQPLEALISLGKQAGYSFALETQGSAVQPWFSALDFLIVSPKPPSSGAVIDKAVLDEVMGYDGRGPSVSLKFPLLDEADYRFAREVARRYPAAPVYLQPVNHTPPRAGDEAGPDHAGLITRLEQIMSWAQADHWHDVHILPQLHVMLWGNKTGV